jgi:hypothetical protein
MLVVVTPLMIVVISADVRVTGTLVGGCCMMACSTVLVQVQEVP